MVTLLIYAAQLFSASAHAVFMLDMPVGKAEMSSSCHSDMDAQASSAQHDSDADVSMVGSCCDGDCSMASCSSVSAILGSYKVLALQSFRARSFELQSNPLSEQTRSLFRPPILG